MTVCKATFSGTVFRGPEKRATQNNVPITFFTLRVDGKEELLVRVVSMGKAAETAANELSKDDRIVAEGKLRIGTVKDEDNSDKRIMELELSSFEKTGGASKLSNPDRLVQFDDKDYSDDLLGEEEIPF